MQSELSERLLYCIVMLEAIMGILIHTESYV